MTDIFLNRHPQDGKLKCWNESYAAVFQAHINVSKMFNILKLI